MKSSSLVLALGLVLVLIAATTVAVYAAGTAYLDFTGTLNHNPGFPVGSPQNPATDINSAIASLTGGTGIIIYIYDTGRGLGWCEIAVTDGKVNWQPRRCNPGTPPGTGEPIAMATWWIAGAVAAAALVLAGFVVRRRQPQLV